MKKSQPLIIRIGNRIVPYDMVLGVQGYDTFKLKADQILEVLEIDEHGRGLVLINGKKVWMWAKNIDQVSNEIK